MLDPTMPPPTMTTSAVCMSVAIVNGRVGDEGCVEISSGESGSNPDADERQQDVPPKNP